MTLLDAPSYNAARARRTRNLLIGLAVLLVAVGIFLYVFWDWPEEHRVNQFFAAVQAQDFPKAFAIWNNDPNWQQHPDKYLKAGYPYGRFLVDWSKSGEYGVITSHKILYAATFGNNVIMAVEVNGRKTPLTLGVEHKTHVIGFTPFTLTPVQNALGLTSWQISYQ